MKILRILTGIHAGASLELTHGLHRIGSDEEADVCLTDWQGPDATLDVDAADVVRITRDLAGNKEGAGDPVDNEEAGSVLLVDFVPMQFDDLVLCIGPNDVAWPADVDLLSTLLASPVKSQLASFRRQQQRRHQLIAVAGCAVLGSLIVAGTLVGTTQLSRAAFPPSADERTVRVAQALVDAHVSGLHAQALGNTVVVTGMVATPSDDSAVRALLQRVAPNGVERRYDVAQDDARSLQDSLGIVGTHVSYGGDGRFLITGTVADMDGLRAAVARVRGDLDSNVKMLVIQAQQASSPVPEAPATYSEMVATDDVRYAETPDGVKHIFAIDIPASSPVAASSPQVDAPVAASGGVNATPASPAVRATAAYGTSFPGLPNAWSPPPRRSASASASAG
ncbi:secretion protein [Trinickia acidisoli]|uniref:secretion protein n=1 Tax=Trinickia acidisoli TaxID=2767482 RepID=UPI001A8D8599|nr:secretion protein [Trinickia acidisoli]